MNKSINLERLQSTLENILNDVIEAQREKTIDGSEDSIDLYEMLVEMSADLAQIAALLSGAMADRAKLSMELATWKMRYSLAKEFLTDDEQRALDSRINAVEDGRSNA